MDEIKFNPKQLKKWKVFTDKWGHLKDKPIEWWDALVLYYNPDKFNSYDEIVARIKKEHGDKPSRAGDKFEWTVKEFEQGLKRGREIAENK